jgi:hypothetical protein
MGYNNLLPLYEYKLQVQSHYGERIWTHSFGTKLKPMAASSEHEKESSGSIKGRGFLERLAT